MQSYLENTKYSNIYNMFYIFFFYQCLEPQFRFRMSHLTKAMMDNSIRSKVWNTKFNTTRFAWSLNMEEVVGVICTDSNFVPVQEMNSAQWTPDIALQQALAMEKQTVSQLVSKLNHHLDTSTSATSTRFHYGDHLLSVFQICRHDYVNRNDKLLESLHLPNKALNSQNIKMLTLHNSLKTRTQTAVS